LTGEPPVTQPGLGDPLVRAIMPGEVEPLVDVILESRVTERQQVRLLAARLHHRPAHAEPMCQVIGHVDVNTAPGRYARLVVGERAVVPGAADP
jgi:hypothetical protein